MNQNEIKKLCKKAKEVSKNAHAPYSKFFVGAALLTENGKIYTGCNVESSSYGLTICAERNAITASVADGAKKYTAMAIYSENAAAPCGACRQLIWDICRDIPIYSVGEDNIINKMSTVELLPKPFDDTKLRR